MKILSSEEIRNWDAYTIKHEPISSIDLMERASTAFCDWFVKKFDQSKSIKIFCGPGNNGGDGLAISRLLFHKGYKVNTYPIFSERTSEDFKINDQRLLECYPVQYIKEECDIPEIICDEIVIDAIFGSGLSKAVSGIFAAVINKINLSRACVVSVDIASGLFCSENNLDSTIIRPNYTISFQAPKLSFLLPQNESYVGEWEVVDIGLHPDYIKETQSKSFYTKDVLIKSIIKRRPKFSNKGTFGSALIISGSYGMMGAAVLSTKACLRSGVGLCISYVPECGYGIMQTSIPENMVIADKENKFISDIPDLKKYTAIGVGPGLGRDKATANALKKLFEQSHCPLVIDADALNIISENKELLDKIPQGSILTPHPKEFERIAGPSNDEYHRLQILSSLAVKIKSVIVLKGASTAIASPEGSIHFNSNGNPGMATAGTGDVLTGIITSLLAQGYTSLHSAILGVYLHGYAGDVAAETKSIPSLIASDIIDAIPEFYKKYY